MTDPRAFTALTDYLSKVPPVSGSIGTGDLDGGGWWVKFTIDVDHELAWHAVQELGHVLNYLSLEERLPTVFKPVSPPPYLNGGPDDYLSWVIECDDAEFKPGTVAKWLEERLPKPVDDEDEWRHDDDDEEDDEDEDDDDYDDDEDDDDEEDEEDDEDE